MVSIIRDYIRNSYFHGFHYLVDPGLHWTERLFWLLSLFASWSGCIYLMMTWLEIAYLNPISLQLDTNYLLWKTPLPAIVICEMNSVDLKLSNNAKLQGQLKQRIFYEYYISDEVQHNFSDKMWLLRDYLSNCSEILNYCTWQGKEFDCCEKFQPMQTAYGKCFAINSIQTKDSNWDKLLYINKGDGKLEIEFKNPFIKVYAITNEGLVTDSSKSIIFKKEIKDYDNYTEYKVFLSAREISSDPEIREVDIERRKCRFPDENYLNVANSYSYDACKLQCQKNIHFKMFNCTHHFMPNTDNINVCNEHYLKKISETSRIWHEEIQYTCHCDLSCIENNVIFLGKYTRYCETVPKKKASTRSYLYVNIQPNHDKIIRKRANSNLENIVNVGGTAGLFIGASLLSIVEIIYYFTIRALNTVLIENKKSKKVKSKPKTKNQNPELQNVIFVEVYPFVN